MDRTKPDGSMRAEKLRERIDFRIALLRAGMTQVDLAKRLDISQRYLTYILSGERGAPELRHAIEQITGCSLPPSRYRRKAAIKCRP